MKKRAFTLIEVSICLVLLSLLLGGLFFFYGHFSKQKYILEKAKWNTYETRLFQQRLEKIFSSCQKPFFAAEKPLNIAFLFDRGLSENPLLSGIVLGKLYYDEENCALRFAIWPNPASEAIKEPSENTLLLEDVTEPKFEYYWPPNVYKKDVDPDKIQVPIPKEKWQRMWSSKYEGLPAFIKIEMKHKGNDVTYIFDLPTPILYPPEKIET